jgi:uncharacterized protein YdiU (UPF0061 family)
MAGWRLERTYASLPELFHAPAAPTPVQEPRLVVLNRPLAVTLGLDPDELDTPEGAAIFAGSALPPGSQPLAQAYAGHQFGHFTALGDGRAILLGEQVTLSGERYDVQLKGAGQTPYSRRGDGRAALGPMLREFIISEAMHGLGIPTTRSLAVATTGEPVFRETVLEGAVLTRVAASHIRVGTMEWAAAHKDHAALGALADYTRARHYPELADAAEPHAAFLDAIVARQARLVAQWQLVGFIHGVMNTDNMALSGETIDYGPCAFMDAYEPATVFSSIDHGGRYAYGNQPPIAQWNLARLAEAMVPLIDADQARAVERATASIVRFQELYAAAWLSGMRGKLGLFTEEDDWMQGRAADFTNTFRMVSSPALVEAMTRADAAFGEWYARLEARRGRQPQSAREAEELMRRHNPVVIPRNHKVEEALAAATTGHDFGVLERLLEVLRQPFDHDRDPGDFGVPARSGRPYQTFCGT